MDRIDPHSLLYLGEVSAQTIHEIVGVNLISLVIILPILDVVLPHNLDFAVRGVLLPLAACVSVGSLACDKSRRQLTSRKSTFLSSFCSWCLSFLML